MLPDLRREDTNLKPALKKQPKAKENSRSVSWADESKRNAVSDSEKTESKESSIITNADETLKSDKVSRKFDINCLGSVYLFVYVQWFLIMQGVHTRTGNRLLHFGGAVQINHCGCSSLLCCRPLRM